MQQLKKETGGRAMEDKESLVVTRWRKWERADSTKDRMDGKNVVTLTSEE